MESQRLIFENHGKPSQCLRLESFSPPELKEGEVLLEIEASPLNPADLNYIEGTYGIKPTLPAIPGMECSATVSKSRAAEFPEGCRVIPIQKIDAWATHAITSAEHLIRVPSAIDPLQAAMLKVNPATAWLLLRDFAKLNAGDWVALNASNSGVGQCTIQLAASLGINTLCFLRNESQFSELRELGATGVFPDSKSGLEAATDLLAKERAKLAFNAVGGESALRIMKLLGYGGTHITYGAMARKPLTVPNGPLIFSDIRLRGLWVTKWMERTPRTELEAVYASLAQQITEGKLRQLVDSTHQLQDFPAALARLEANNRRGKVLFATNV